MSAIATAECTIRGRANAGGSDLGALTHSLVGVTPYQQLLDLAARQHVCVTSAQARSCGLTDPQVRHHIRNGSLERVGARALRLVGVPPTWSSS